MKKMIGLLLLVLLSVAGSLNAATASFVGPETTVQGMQHSSRGTDGYFAALLDTDQGPRYATIDQTWASSWLWAFNVTDPRSVVVRDIFTPGLGIAQPGHGIASCWYDPKNNLTLPITINDNNTHLVSLYAVDYDNGGRTETVYVYDTMTGILLDTETLSDFSQGAYLVWNISGNVTFQVIATSGVNPVVSAIFFDPQLP